MFVILGRECTGMDVELVVGVDLVQNLVVCPFFPQLEQVKALIVGQVMMPLVFVQWEENIFSGLPWFLHTLQWGTATAEILEDC